MNISSSSSESSSLLLASFDSLSDFVLLLKKSKMDFLGGVAFFETLGVESDFSDCSSLYFSSTCSAALDL